MTVGWGESVVGRTPSMIPVFKVYTNQFWTGLGWAQLGWVVYRGHNTQPAAASIERVCPSLPRHYHRHNVGVFTPPFGDCGQHLWMMMSSGCDWWRPGHVTPVRAGQVTWWWAAAVIGGDRVTWPRWELARSRDPGESWPAISESSTQLPPSSTRLSSARLSAAAQPAEPGAVQWSWLLATRRSPHSSQNIGPVSKLRYFPMLLLKSSKKVIVWSGISSKLGRKSKTSSFHLFDC